MRSGLLLASGIVFAVALDMSIEVVAESSDKMALIGTVSSVQDGPIEGVLISAKKDHSTISLTVVSDVQGRYAFPAARLEPGRYSMRIRAVGYDLDGPESIDITPRQTTELDLKLRKTEDLASQLSNGEWIASMPGADAQKGALLNCTGCHTLERVVRSDLNANDFMSVLQRMQGYVNQSIPAHPQLRRAERLMEERGDQRVQVQRQLADYLATINLSAAPVWTYML